MMEWVEKLRMGNLWGHHWKNTLHFSKTFLHSLQEPSILYTAVLGNLLMVICAALFHWFEKGVNPNVKDFFDSLWWAFTTVTTVGYGDVVPQTVQGKVTAILLMIMGVSFFLTFTGLLMSHLASRLARTVLKTEAHTLQEYKELKELVNTLNQQLCEMKRQLNKSGQKGSPKV